MTLRSLLVVFLPFFICVRYMRPIFNIVKQRNKYLCWVHIVCILAELPPYSIYVIKRTPQNIDVIICFQQTLNMTAKKPAYNFNFFVLFFGLTGETRSLNSFKNSVRFYPKVETSMIRSVLD